MKVVVQENKTKNIVNNDVKFGINNEKTYYHFHLGDKSYEYDE